MIHHRNLIAEAAERAVRVAHIKAAVVRALAFWETWIILAAIAHVSAHLEAWRELAFRVVGR